MSSENKEKRVAEKRKSPVIEELLKETQVENGKIRGQRLVRERLAIMSLDSLLYEGSDHFVNDKSNKSG